MLRLRLLVGAVACLVAIGDAAFSAPPPVGSEDWEIMHPFAEWVTHQHDQRGYWCCDWSDGRPVDARINADGHWEAHVTPAHWPGAKDHWVTIPDEKVLHQANPTGVAIFWYATGTDNPYCFAPASGT